MAPKTKKQNDIERTVTLIDQGMDSILNKILSKINNDEIITLSEIQILKEIKAELRQAEPESRIVSTQKEVAKHIGKSMRTIAYYKNQGMPINDNGTYDLDAILIWLKDHKKANRQPKKKGIITRIKERVLPGNKIVNSFPHPRNQ